MSFVPFTPDEQVVIEAYLNNLPVDASIAAACDRFEVPESLDVLRTAIGAGMILLYSVQDRLPNFSTRNKEGEIAFGRTRRRRKGTASLAFIPQHLFTLNWADSGPGISWPESYWAVHVPIYERIVVVASRDGDEPWGCADHAIGHFPVGRSIVPTSGRILQANWRALIDHHEQEAWAYVWDPGLVEGGKGQGLARAGVGAGRDSACATAADVTGYLLPLAAGREVGAMAKRVETRMSSERIALLQESIRQLNERLRAQGRTVIVEEGTDSKDLKVTFPQGRRPPPAKREEG